MGKRVTSIRRGQLSDPPDSGLSRSGTPPELVALVATLTAEAWSLAGLHIPQYDRAATPIYIRSLRAAPLTGVR